MPDMTSYPPVSSIPEANGNPQQAEQLLQAQGITPTQANPVITSLKTLAAATQSVIQSGDPRGAGMRDGLVMILNSMQGAAANTPLMGSTPGAPAPAPAPMPAAAPAPAPAPVAAAPAPAPMAAPAPRPAPAPVAAPKPPAPVVGAPKPMPAQRPVGQGQGQVPYGQNKNQRPVSKQPVLI